MLLGILVYCVLPLPLPSTASWKSLLTPFQVQLPFSFSGSMWIFIIEFPGYLIYFLHSMPYVIFFVYNSIFGHEEFFYSLVANGTPHMLGFIDPVVFWGKFVLLQLD